MSQITFWSPDHGRGGTTFNTVAVGTMMGLEYDIRTLITQTQFSRSNLESAFFKSKENHMRNLNAMNTGLDALERLVKTKKLQPDNISNHAIPLEPGRLDLLIGTNKTDESHYEGLEPFIQTIFQEANRYYQAVLVDAHSGARNALTNKIIETSEMVVVNLSQDSASIERFLSQEDMPCNLKDKPHIILIGQYDPDSKYSLSNIKRTFDIDCPIYTLPYCTDFRDAFNDKDVLGWFRRSRNVNRKHENHYFFQEVRKFVNALLQEIGVNTQLKHLERGVS